VCRFAVAVAAISCGDVGALARWPDVWAFRRVGSLRMPLSPRDTGRTSYSNVGCFPGHGRSAVSIVRANAVRHSDCVEAKLLPNPSSSSQGRRPQGRDRFAKGVRVTMLAVTPRLDSSCEALATSGERNASMRVVPPSTANRRSGLTHIEQRSTDDQGWKNR